MFQPHFPVCISHRLRGLERRLAAHPCCCDRNRNENTREIQRFLSVLPAFGSWTRRPSISRRSEPKEAVPEVSACPRLQGQPFWPPAPQALLPKQSLLFSARSACLRFLFLSAAQEQRSAPATHELSSR